MKFEEVDGILDAMCGVSTKMSAGNDATNDGRLERQYDDGGSAAFDVCKRICGWATKRVGSARLTASHVADAGWENNAPQPSITHRLELSSAFAHRHRAHSGKVM